MCSPLCQQASAQDSIHVVLQIMTAYPDVAARVFANSFTLASLLQPLGLSISPTSVQVSLCFCHMGLFEE